MSSEEEKDWNEIEGELNQSDEEKKDSELETSEPEPKTTEPEPETSEPEPETTEPEPETTEPESKLLTNGIYKAKLKKKTKEGYIFNIIDNNENINVNNSATGYWQLKHCLIDSIINVEIKLDRDNIANIIWIDAINNIYKGKITRITNNSDNNYNSYGFLSLSNRYEENISLYIPENVTDTNNEFNFDKLTKGDYVTFTIKNSITRIYEYEVSTITVFEWNTGQINKLDRNKGYGYIRPDKVNKENKEKTDVYIWKFNIDNFNKLHHLQDVKYIADAKNHAIKIFINENN